MADETYKTTPSLSIGGDVPTWEGEATVEFDISWGRPAKLYGAPENCYPADPDEVTDVRLLAIDGKPGPWGDWISDSKHIEQNILDHISEDDLIQAALDQLP